MLYAKIIKIELKSAVHVGKKHMPLPSKTNMGPSALSKM